MSAERRPTRSAAWPLVALLLCGCGDRPSFDPGEECELNTQCAAPFVCRLGHCRVECRAQRDCVAGLECVRDEGGFGACQLEDEAHCTFASDCPDFLVCRFGRCTNACGTNIDCPPGSRCEDDGSGMFGCRDAADRECMLNSDCMDELLICAPDGRCREPCHNDRDCRDGTVCESLTSPTMCVAPGVRMDGGFDAGVGMDAGPDGGRIDSGVDSGSDAGLDAAVDAGRDATTDGGTDAGTDGGMAMVTPPPAALMVGGFEYTCAAPTPTDLRCWGANATGQLGDGTRTRRTTATRVVGVTDVSIVAAGASHACAATATEVLCWGDNATGQLARSPAGGTYPMPMAVAGLPSPVTDLSAGLGHTCAIASAQLYCWGDNSQGQLGDGTTMSHTTPAMVTLPRTPVQVSTYASHTCVRMDNGDVSCFGDNNNGAVGNGTVGGPVSTPAPVLGLGPSVQVAAGGSHSCAIEVSGVVKCWGDRNLGQCGDIAAADTPPFAIRPSAGAVLGTIVGPALQIAAGSAHVCARTAFALYCWGDNGTSQCGVTVPGFYVRQPTEVAAAGMVDEVAVGSGHTCYRQRTAVSCFGWDSAGQLGDGTPGGSRRDPAPVMWL